SDATAPSGAAGDDWTTSALMADLNGDALPDIYAVNYLSGDVFERNCENHGVPMQCAPTMFPGAQDRLYLSNGDGSFRDATDAAGIRVPDGKGLGIVAADFDGSGRLSLFIANDTTANFFWVNESRDPGGIPKLVERAISSGVAFDAEGRAQACMGIGAADCDGNGLLDLFVTNFYNESNTLYLQRSPLQFSDETRPAGLRDPGFARLGFGTQFLDGELDGWPDLVVTNGHINDFHDEKIPYRMSPQYYRNRGAGRFDEASSQVLGPYFAGAYLGRALAKLDWNADGLADFVVTHVDRPPALLTNRTERIGKYIALELRGVAGERDAIGATVRVRVGGREWLQQVTAGDGFECTNQRRLIFGLGDAGSVDECTIRWRSGHEQSYRDLEPGQTHLVIEGRPQLLRLP
ncbi:MAG TPA: CRTAC1 family protein, partial [Planctomycetaceae bacterium]|nr:CRTAC1 family protein [Planctomycetaceae bacterium]